MPYMLPLPSSFCPLDEHWKLPWMFILHVYTNRELLPRYGALTFMPMQISM